MTSGRLAAYDVRPRGPYIGTGVLIPGFTGSRDDFRALIPFLVDGGWRVIAFSQRGQPGSVTPIGESEYGLDAFAQDAVEISGAAESGRPVHVVGHSFGGVVAQAAVLRSPEQFRSLTLLCSGPRGWSGRHVDTETIVRASGSLGLWEHQNPGCASLSDSELGPELAFTRQKACETSDDNLLASVSILRKHVDVTEGLRRTNVPVHVAHGEFDDKWPIPEQRAMAARLRARYSVIERVGHSPQAEAPSATGDCLTRFWADSSTAYNDTE